MRSSAWRRAGGEQEGLLGQGHRRLRVALVVGGAQAGRAQVELGRRAPLAGPGRLLGERRGVAGVGGRGRLQPLQRLAGAGGGGVEVERRAQGPRGQGVVERLVEERRPQPCVLRRQRGRRHPAAAGGVEGLQGGRPAAEGELAAQGRGAGLVLAGVEAAGAGVEEAGPVAADEPLLEHLAHPEVEAGRLRQVRGAVGLALQRLGQRGLVAALLAERHHGLQRGGVARVGVEGLAVERLGAGGVAQAPVRQRGRLGQEVSRRRARPEPRAPLQQRHQVLEAAVLTVEGVQRLEGALVGRRGLQRGQVGFDLLLERR